MGSALLFIPPYSGKANWEKTDNLPFDVRSALERYCLCGVEWEDKDAGTIRCAANDKCEGEDCIFWTLTYQNIESMKIIQDIKIQKFGEKEPDPSGTVLKFGDPKTFKSLKFPRNGKDGDIHPSALSQVVFCSCGTQEEIGAIKAKHESVKAPDDDPPK